MFDWSWENPDKVRLRGGDTTAFGGLWYLVLEVLSPFETFVLVRALEKFQYRDVYYSVVL